MLILPVKIETNEVGMLVATSPNLPQFRVAAKDAAEMASELPWCARLYLGKLLGSDLAVALDGQNLIVTGEPA